MKKISDFFGKIKTWANSHKTLFALIITALFVLIHIPLVINHEIWDDEATVWALSKEVNLGNVYEVNSVEPHPFLWELMLAPLSQSGMPIISMNILSLALVALAVFLFFRFAPFGYPAKFIFLLSNAIAYYNPVIARDYSLIPLAVCLVCMAYGKRHEKPLRFGLALAFMAQTHFLMYGLIGILVVGFVFEDTQKKAKLGKMLKNVLLVMVPVIASIAITIPMVVGSMNGQALITEKDVNASTDIGTLFQNSTEAFVGVYNPALTVVLCIILIAVILAFFSENIKIAFYSFVSIAFWFFVMAFIYKGYYVIEQKVSIITLFILFGAWLIVLEKNEKKNVVSKILEHSEIIKYLRLKMKRPAIIMACFFALLSVPCTVVSAVEDVSREFSSSRYISSFINDKFEDGSLVIRGDVISSVGISISTLVQVNKKIDFFSVPLNDFDYESKLKFDGKDHEQYQTFSYLADEDLQKMFDYFGEKYEHIYYISAIPGCSNLEYYNEPVVSKYENLGRIENKEYIQTRQYPMQVFKIK